MCLNDVSMNVDHYVIFFLQIFNKITLTMPGEKVAVQLVAVNKVNGLTYA